MSDALDNPVSHDDRHGTANTIVAGLLIAMGTARENGITLVRRGGIHLGRKDLEPYAFAVAAKSEARTLKECDAGRRYL